MRTAKTLIRLGGCPGWSESSLGTHSFCWFCHVVAHIRIKWMMIMRNDKAWFWLIINFHEEQKCVFCLMYSSWWKQDFWKSSSDCRFTHCRSLKQHTCVFILSVLSVPLWKKLAFLQLLRSSEAAEKLRKSQRYWHLRKKLAFVVGGEIDL